ncbi:MAG: tetratricopeptide repeat protein [Planctomycetes bacterium]|nr:tetratricopeptide repeat protein [Planctomycetota bacterium]
MDTSKLTEKAAVAAERGQYDYAVDLYLRLLDLQPQHVEARKALRAVEIRRCQERGVTKSGASGWIRGIGHLLTAVIYLLIRKYEKSIIACESFLKNDPFNGVVLRLLARAAEKAGHIEVAILVLEDVRVGMGSALKGFALHSRVRVLRRLGELYAQAERLPLAAERFEEILKLAPGDREAEVRIRDIAAQRSMVEGGWDKAGKVGGYRDVLKDEAAAVRLEDTQRDIRTREDVMANIERVKNDLVKEPNNTRHLVQLGDLYKMLKDWATAREQYEKAQAIDPHNFMVSERLGDLRLAEMDQELEALAGSAAEQDRLAQLRRERTKVAFEEYQRRAKARPQDLPTRFALANILFDVGRFKEASAQFQLASRDPRHRRTALYRLGVCFQKQKLVDLAVEQFEKAIAGASLVDQEVKDIMYALGEAHESQGRLAEALNAYKRVFEIDIGYRDVSKKIEELYKLGAKDTA